MTLGRSRAVRGFAQDVVKTRVLAWYLLLVRTVFAMPASGSNRAWHRRPRVLIEQGLLLNAR